MLQRDSIRNCKLFYSKQLEYNNLEHHHHHRHCLPWKNKLSESTKWIKKSGLILCLVLLQAGAWTRDLLVSFPSWMMLNAIESLLKPKESIVQGRSVVDLYFWRQPFHLLKIQTSCETFFSLLNSVSHLLIFTFLKQSRCQLYRIKRKSRKKRERTEY